MNIASFVVKCMSDLHKSLMLRGHNRAKLYPRCIKDCKVIRVSIRAKRDRIDNAGEAFSGKRVIVRAKKRLDVICALRSCNDIYRADTVRLSRFGVSRSVVKMKSHRAVGIL